MKTRNIINQLPSMSFLLILIGQILFSSAAHSQDGIPIKIVLKDSNQFFVPLDQTEHVQPEELENGQVKVIKVQVKDISMQDESEPYNLEIAVKKKPNAYKHFNLFYNSQAPLGTVGVDKIGMDQFKRFDLDIIKNGTKVGKERQLDLFNLAFDDNEALDIAYKFNPPLPDWLDFQPQVIVTPPGQAPTTGGLLNNLSVDKLQQLPYINEIWGKVENVQDLRTIPPVKFAEFFQNLKTKNTNFDVIFKTMGIHNGFNALKNIRDIYGQFANFRFDGTQKQKEEYSKLKNYGTFYLALLGKDPEDLKALIKLVDSIEKRAENKEEIGVKDLEVLNEAARFVARAAIMARHAGLFYYYSNAIINLNPELFKHFKTNSTSTSDQLTCSPESLNEEDQEMMKKFAAFSELLKKQKEEQALAAYKNYFGGMGSSSSSVKKPSFSATSVFDADFDMVTISGSGLRCWMRSTWFSIFDFFKNNPEALIARIKEIFKGEQIPDTVTTLMAEADKILNPKVKSRFGISSGGLYEPNTEKAIFLVTRQIVLNRMKELANEQKKFQKEVVTLVQKLKDGDTTLSLAEKQAIVKAIATAKGRGEMMGEFIGSQKVLLNDMDTGNDGTTDVMAQMFEAIVGHDALPERNDNRTLLLLTSFAPYFQISSIGTPQAQLDRNKASFGGIIHQPIIYGTGGHFDIFIPKEKTLTAREELDKKSHEELVAKITENFKNLNISNEDNRDWLRAAFYLMFERAKKQSSSDPTKLSDGITNAYKAANKEIPPSVSILLFGLDEYLDLDGIGLGEDGKFDELLEPAILQIAKDLLVGDEQQHALDHNGKGQRRWMHELVKILGMGQKGVDDEIPLVRLGRFPAFAHQALTELEKAQRPEDSIVVFNPDSGFNIFAKK